MRSSDWSSDVCSSDLQEAGATPVQELAFALATAVAVLDSLRDSGQVPPEDFPQVVGRISFFVNAEPSMEDILRSEEHTSELQSLMRISYAVFCLKKNTPTYQHL